MAMLSSYQERRRQEAVKPPTPNAESCRVSVRAAAEAGRVADAVVAAMAAAGYPDRDRFAVRLALEEAVANAVKHGRATLIHISLHFEKDGVRLTIADNGCGFVPEERDPAPASGQHLGLLTMRERAARLRGRLALISNPGAGTTIEAAVPQAAE